ncbi:MAG: type II toxin-antitoxin system YafQ family toxin [Lactobacillus sp.]|jgi:mRNA interferase YafQ|nr:type II toxin-antitoxin system YafQ family toxin [Lactobacillus sp.]
MSNFEIYASPTFKKELKRLKRKHYPINLITICLQAIMTRDPANLTKIKDHPLTGNWKGFREFHTARIESHGHRNYDQWIVIYKISDQKLILTLVATGNHEILTKHDPKIM